MYRSYISKCFLLLLYNSCLRFVTRVYIAHCQIEKLKERFCKHILSYFFGHSSVGLKMHAYTHFSKGLIVGNSLSLKMDELRFLWIILNIPFPNIHCLKNVFTVDDILVSFNGTRRQWIREMKKN